MAARMMNNLLNSIQDNCINSNSGFQHFSGIYRNGKPYYTGNNSLRNVYNGNCTCFSTHAEMDVLHKMLKVEARTTI